MELIKLFKVSKKKPALITLSVVFIFYNFTSLKSETIIIGSSGKPTIEINLDAKSYFKSNKINNLHHFNEKIDEPINLIPPPGYKKLNKIKNNKSNFNKNNIKIEENKKPIFKNNSAKLSDNKEKILRKKLPENKIAVTKSLKNENKDNLNFKQSYQILFQSNSTSMPKKYEKNLLDLANKVIANNKRFQIKAYANSQGNKPSHARRVSLSRALSVRSYLIQQGVLSTNIDVRALGKPNDNKPVDRVDVLILP